MPLQIGRESNRDYLSFGICSKLRRQCACVRTTALRQGADLGLRDPDPHNLYAAASKNARGLTDDLRPLFARLLGISLSSLTLAKATGRASSRWCSEKDCR